MNSLIAICGGKPERREAAKTRTGISASLHKRAEGIARILNLFGPLFWDARNPTPTTRAHVKLFQEPFRVRRVVNHCCRPFLAAVSDDWKRSGLEFHDDGKPEARPRNFTARAGNHAC
ncbi:hypothetical protein EL18_02098 [Nitratireductor basaltis]|uniref:Uncharacterized protein n=1 Tax=Nitratireductor basaltis TaxID=472175 RepID=A0A084UDM0_9HYPH|nr:hypothetical protein EL18_02098 [Nitratireductor basaltis]